MTFTTTPFIYWMNMIEPIAQLSLYKLYQQENALEEPVLRKKVLIRNTLLTTSMVSMEQEKQKEQVWLDACFDQLDEDMEDTTTTTTAAATATTINDDSGTTYSVIPPPPPLPILPPSLVSPFVFPTSVSSSVSSSLPLTEKPSSKVTLSSQSHLENSASSSPSSHTLLFAIPPEHEKLLALLDWSWSASTSSSSSSTIYTRHHSSSSL